MLLHTIFDICFLFVLSDISYTSFENIIFDQTAPNNNKEKPELLGMKMTISTFYEKNYHQILIMFSSIFFAGKYEGFLLAAVRHLRDVSIYR